jgi:hypothetical protein
MVQGAPSMWHPKGDEVWKNFMKDEAKREAYFRAIRSSTLEFFKGKGFDMKQIMAVLDEAGL